MSPTKRDKPERSPTFLIFLGAVVIAAIVVVAITVNMIQREEGTGPSLEGEQAIVSEETEVKSAEAKGSRRAMAVLYLEECAGCHGADREGAMGPALIPQLLASRSDEELKDIILNGIPDTAMPGWMDKLTLERIDGLITYLKTTPVKEEELNWELEDIQKSLTVLAPEEELPAKPAHQARIEDLMLIVERDFSSVFVVDGRGNEPLGQIMAGYKTHVINYDPVEERWAYLIARNGWVFKLDLYNLKPVRKVRVGIDSRSLAVSGDGRYLLAGNYIPNSAVILDAQTLEPLKVIETHGIDPDGEVVGSRVGAALSVGRYFLIVLQEAGSVWFIDHSSPNFPVVETVDEIGHLLLGAYLVPGGRYLITGSQVDDFVAVLDLEEPRLVKRVPTGRKPYMGAGAAIEVGGRELLFVPAVGENKLTVLEVGSWEVVKYIFTKGPGLFVASHPKSRYVWADVAFGPNSGAVHVIDKQTLEIVKTRWPGKRSVHPEFTADGRYVYVSAWGEDKVVVYDAATLERVREFHDVKTPTGIFSGGRRELNGL